MSEARLQAFRQRRFLFVCKQAQYLTSCLKASQHLYPGLIFVTLDLGLLLITCFGQHNFLHSW